MAKIIVRHPISGGSSLTINPDLAIDVQSFPGLFNSNCTINSGSIPAIFQQLNYISGIKVKDLKLSDLMFPAYYCNGVYLFYDVDNVLLSNSNLTKPSCNPYKIVYIGKAGGRSLIERIAAHFASRDNDFMNNMIKNMANLLYKAKTDVEIDKCFPIVKEFYLKIIYFPAYCSNVDICIKQLENTLIHNYGRPILNNR